MQFLAVETGLVLQHGRRPNRLLRNCKGSIYGTLYTVTENIATVTEKSTFFYICENEMPRQLPTKPLYGSKEWYMSWKDQEIILSEIILWCIN